MDDGAQAELRRKFEKLMKALFKQKGAYLDISILADQEAQEFIQTHADILDSGFYKVKMSEAMRRRLTRSDYIFSGIKTFHELNEAFPSLLDENGERKPFEQFLNDVLKVDSTYNVNYLRAEYNFVQASAEMAAKWEQYAEDGDRYNLQYRTAGDDRVRPEHQILDGITLPMSDPFWEEFYPPNGWNCFEGTTPVLTDKGWRPIREIQRGDLVVGGSGKLRKVIATHAKEVDDELVRIVTKGATATCTKNHRFRTLRGWIAAEDLQRGDIIVQLGKISPIHPLVNAIGNAHTILRYALMALVRKWKSVTALAVDDEAQAGDVEVHNETSEELSAFEWYVFGRQIARYDTLGLAQWLTQRTHALGMGTACGRGGGDGTFPNLWAKKRGIYPQLFCNVTDKLAVRFSLALSYVKTLLRKPVVGLSKSLARLGSALRIVSPLRADGVAAMTDGNAASFERTHDSAEVDTPMGCQPTDATLFHGISLTGSGTEPHAFNGFYTMCRLFGKSFSHNRYMIVEDKVTKNKAKTSVYNLSVAEDESYVVPVGIAHNCRCSVVQVRKTKHPETPHEQAMALGEDALKDDTKGIFRFNSGIEGKTFPDYNPYTMRRCRDCDIAKGKLDLAFVPENVLCEACNLLHGLSVQETIRRLNREERIKVQETALTWANKHLPKVVMSDGTTASRLSVQTDEGVELHVGKTFFTETYAKNKNSRRLAETMETATHVDEWIRTARQIGTEPGRHHDFNFAVFKANYHGHEIEFKAKMTEGLIVYLMRLI